MSFCRGLLMASLFGLAGCASLVDRATNNFAAQLSSAVLDHDDPETVAQGLPTFLLTMDAMNASPDAKATSLCRAADLYGAYAGSFVTEPVRSKRLAARAFDYAQRAACQAGSSWCDVRALKFEEIEALAKASNDPAHLNCIGGAWAGFIQANADDWDAIAGIPKARRLMERVIEIDPQFGGGQPLMVLGVVNSLLPPAYGGRPDVAKSYFDQALSTSNGDNQMVRVLYAKFYARLVFDQALHDRLLDEALAAPAKAPGLTLINTLAQRQARLLKDTSEDYFE